MLHQVLDKEPQVWGRIDHRLRALSAADDLIARVDGSGCDIRDLLLSELGPYDHVRFNLNGDPLFLPARLAVSLALIFHELATNAAKYGAFSSPRGMLQVSWTCRDDRLNVIWDETEGPPVDADRRSRVRHQTAEIGADRVRRQDRDHISSRPAFIAPCNAACRRAESACESQALKSRRDARCFVRRGAPLMLLLMTMPRHRRETHAGFHVPCFHERLTKIKREPITIRGHARRDATKLHDFASRRRLRRDQAELGLLREVLRLLPAGVTVQDTHGIS